MEGLRTVWAVLLFDFWQFFFFKRYEYHWCDKGKYKKPTSVPAIEVNINLMQNEWIILFVNVHLSSFKDHYLLWGMREGSVHCQQDCLDEGKYCLLCGALPVKFAVKWSVWWRRKIPIGVYFLKLSFNFPNLSRW